VNRCTGRLNGVAYVRRAVAEVLERAASKGAGPADDRGGTRLTCGQSGCWAFTPEQPFQGGVTGTRGALDRYSGYHLYLAERSLGGLGVCDGEGGEVPGLRRGYGGSEVCVMRRRARDRREPPDA
jgi:hypothetical protein